MPLDQDLIELATYITLCEVAIRLRPLTPDEQSAYHRATERLRRHPLPIPTTLEKGSRTNG